MAIPLPDDPYKALGVDPSAAEADIRKVYLRLVLKCHPDKIQDPFLKAIKVNEFHKIQEAWDLLSDKAKRADYDEKVKINERSNQMRASAAQAKSANYSSPAASPRTYSYEYDVRTAGTPKYAREEADPRMYSPHSSSKPRFSDERYDEPKPRKTTQYESSSRKPSAREMDRQRAMEEGDRQYERERRKEKERKMKDISESKRSRDKEKRRGTEEKTSKKMHPYIVDDDSDDLKYTRSRRSSKKSNEKIRGPVEDAEYEALVDGMQTMSTPSSYDKYHKHEDHAAAYIRAAQATKKKTAPAPPAPPAPPAVRVEELPRRKVQRAETYTYASPTSRYPAHAAFVVDEPEDFARRSSGRSRRTSDTPRRAEASRTSSMSGDGPSVITVEPPSARMKPSLQSYNSAPPNLERTMPIRSQTYDEPPRRAAVPPPPMRSHTYAPTSSNLRQSVPYGSASDSSDSDEDPYDKPAPRRPPVRETRYPTTETVYRVVPGPSNSGARRVEREREVSPRTGARRTGSSTLKVPMTTGKVYYEEPIRQRTVPGGGNGTGGYFGEVNYAPSYDKVSYSPYATKGGDAYYTAPTSRRGEPQFAN